ncbi:hypothetical protein OQ519_16145 [Pseudomonas lurida]|jgi:hypothetical protein|nr:hypothetical protein [Pseudomonas lurida]UZQ72464.1 hypothetical protein OQ519_16145 [Pseudomonas lurida]
MPAEHSVGNGNPAEGYIMEYQSNGDTLQSDGTVNTTVIDWDEFRKYAKVGDTIKEPSRTLRIYDKLYELTASGQHFVVHIYAQ